MYHYALTPEDIEDRLILDSGRDLKIGLPSVFKGTTQIDQHLVEQIKATN